MRLRAAIVLLLGFLLCWGAPLAGLVLAGRPVADFLAFPPRSAAIDHAPFSWIAFGLMSVPMVGAAGLFAAALRRAAPGAAGIRTAARPFAWWGWLGAGLLAAGWVAAWTDGMVAPEWRRHTFTPLWLGYILVVNAFVRRRTGSCPLTDRLAWFACLFPASAAFWWLFEHLNQFVANWHYAGIAAAGDLDYFLQATLPFSTVLPAVASTRAWIAAAARFDRMELPALRGHAAVPWCALAAGVAALGAIGIWPEELYAMLWLAPLLVVLGMQRLLLGSTLLGPLASGDWRPLLQPALAGLLCGFFWELWNYGSLARWHYSIPYVQRFHLFEMPLLGYAGYLPFGLLCVALGDLVSTITRTSHRS